MSKIYVGKGKERMGQYGGFLAVNVCLSDIPKKYLLKGKDNKTYVNLSIFSLSELDRFDNSHTVTINTYIPEGAKMLEDYEVNAREVFDESFWNDRLEEEDDYLEEDETESWDWEKIAEFFMNKYKEEKKNCPTVK